MREAETTLQVSQLTLNGTCVLVTRLCKYCTNYKNSFKRLGTNLSFPDRIIHASMFNDITNWDVSLKRLKWLLTHQDSDLVVGVSVVQDRKRHGHILENTHLTNFADGEWDKIALRMIRELITSKHPVLNLSNILVTGHTSEGGHFGKRPDTEQSTFKRGKQGTTQNTSQI